jgi:FkbM family methyltransferase
MKITFKAPKLFLFFILVLNSTYLLNALEADEENPSIFVGIIIKDNDQSISYFLKTIDKLDYDKSCIQLHMSLSNTTTDIQELLKNWIEKNQPLYKEISCVDNTDSLKELETKIERNKVFGELKNGYLAASKRSSCDYCFILSSDIFLQPNVLKYLVRENKPIIAPLLCPIPEPMDLFRNFYFDTTEDGYFKEHVEYYSIVLRQKKGTFKVPCLLGPHFIKTEYADQLSFTNDFLEWDFIVFSKIARQNSIDQYICNEKEFGFFLQFKTEKTVQEEKEFSLIGCELEITPSVFDSILAPYCLEDLYLKNYADNFDFSSYLIYRINNRDLFYVDDINDYLKTFIIKQNLNWEEHINEQFKKHVKPGSVAIDVGGHIGTHSLNLSKIVGDKGVVHVFEPQAKLFCELAVNMHLNNCNNVLLHHQALGSEEKWIQMEILKEEWMNRFASDFVNEGHALVTDLPEFFAGEKSKMIRLDDLNLNNVSFIKIDVEGFEAEVIKGGLETIVRNKPVMIIEIFQNSETLKKIKEIQALGYTYSSLGGDDYLFIPES